jgi:hypothetical protein
MQKTLFLPYYKTAVYIQQGEGEKEGRREGRERERSNRSHLKQE